MRILNCNLDSSMRTAKRPTVLSSFLPIPITLGNINFLTKKYIQIYIFFKVVKSRDYYKLLKTKWKPFGELKSRYKQLL